eukprot:ANDGO_00409.mRNA.1 hypothetical protein
MKLNSCERFVLLWLDGFLFSIVFVIPGIFDPAQQARALVPLTVDPNLDMIVTHPLTMSLTRLFCSMCIILALTIQTIMRWGSPIAQRRMMQFLSVGDVLHNTIWLHAMFAFGCSWTSDALCHLAFNCILTFTRLGYHIRTMRT